jgi:hypothetical protein
MALNELAVPQHIWEHLKASPQMIPSASNGPLANGQYMEKQAPVLPMIRHTINLQNGVFRHANPLMHQTI